MPLTYEIDAANRRIVITGAGAVDIPMARSLKIAMLRDPAISPALDVLVELSRIECNPTAGHLRTVIGWLPRRAVTNTNKIAVVVGTSFHFGMGRIAATLAEARNIVLHVFLELDKATAWLDSSDPCVPDDDDLAANKHG